MKFLFDLEGRHIANELNGQLYSTSGKHIGYFLSSHKIIIDMKGYYLGEVLFVNRLLFYLNNPWDGIHFGNMDDFGNIGDFGDPGNIGSIGMIPEYSNIDIHKLK